MDQFKYELLEYIRKCPDNYISKEIIYNVCRWNYSKLDSVLQILVDEKLVNVKNLNHEEHYNVSSLGHLYIQNYLENQQKSIKNRKKDFFVQYIFPFLLSLFFFLLGYIVSYYFK